MIKYLLILVSLFVSSYSHAQSGQFSPGDLQAINNIPAIDIVEFKIEKNKFLTGEEVRGSLTIRNLKDFNVPDIKYTISLAGDYSAYGIANKIYNSDLPQNIFLESSKEETVAFVYRLPRNISEDKYGIHVDVSTSAGLPLGWRDVPIILEPNNRKLIEIGDVHLLISGNRFSLQEGPTLKKENLIKFNIKNISQGELTVYPDISNFSRSFITGKEVSKQTSDSITLSAGESKEVRLKIETETLPAGVYEAVLRLVNREGVIVYPEIKYRYILSGNIVTIQNVILDKFSVHWGQRIKLKIMYSGAPVDISGELKNKQSINKTVITLRNENDEIIGQTEDTIDFGVGLSKDLSLFAKRNAKEIKVEILVYDDHNNLITSYRNTLTGSQQAENAPSVFKSSFLLFVAVFIILLILVLGWLVWRRRMSGGNLLGSLLIAIFCLGNSTVFAAEIFITNGKASGLGWPHLYINTPNSIVSAEESFRISGDFRYYSCNNAATTFNLKLSGPYPENYVFPTAMDTPPPAYSSIYYGSSTINGLRNLGSVFVTMPFSLGKNTSYIFASSTDNQNINYGQDLSYVAPTTTGPYKFWFSLNTYNASTTPKDGNLTGYFLVNVGGPEGGQSNCYDYSSDGPRPLSETLNINDPLLDTYLKLDSNYHNYGLGYNGLITNYTGNTSGLPFVSGVDLPLAVNFSSAFTSMGYSTPNYVLSIATTSDHENIYNFGKDVPNAGTVSMWLKLTTSNVGSSARQDIYGSTINNVCFVKPYSNLVQCDLGATGTLLSSTPIQVGKWQHLAFNWNTSPKRQEMWLDGQLVASSTLSSLVKPTSGLLTSLFLVTCPTGVTCPSYPAQRTQFKGVIDDVAFYRRVLTENEIKTIAYSPNYANGICPTPSATCSVTAQNNNFVATSTLTWTANLANKPTNSTVSYNWSLSDGYNPGNVSTFTRNYAAGTYFGTTTLTLSTSTGSTTISALCLRSFEPVGGPCTSGCERVTVVFCGNGIKEASEQCDGTDGVSGEQTCSPLCVIVEPPVICGNNKIEQPEECDNGSLNGTLNNRCSSLCTNIENLSCSVVRTGANSNNKVLVNTVTQWKVVDNANNQELPATWSRSWYVNSVPAGNTTELDRIFTTVGLKQVSASVASTSGRQYYCSTNNSTATTSVVLSGATSEI